VQPQPAVAVRSSLDLAEVRGQAQARRALEIAAAGGHGLLLVGPPGSGKSMLAQRFADLLPPMSDDEALEAAAIASLAGRFTPERWRQRPTASPHHTASAVALVGGGCGFHKKTELHNKILNSGGSPQHISFPH
jgi:magnesium chelatase family protein